MISPGWRGRTCRLAQEWCRAPGWASTGREEQGRCVGRCTRGSARSGCWSRTVRTGGRRGRKGRRLGCKDCGRRSCNGAGNLEEGREERGDHLDLVRRRHFSCIFLAVGTGCRQSKERRTGWHSNWFC